LVEKSLAERTIWIEPNHVAKESMNILVVPGPRLLARGSPSCHPVNLLADALCGLFRFSCISRCRGLLNLL
jgi:hypothetical protein